MIKTEADCIYNRIKNTCGFHRSKKFKKWFHEAYPGMEMHHCFGSFSQSLKTSDYLSIPLTKESHHEAEKGKSGHCIDNLDKLINVLQAYIQFLEGKK